jgi:hypothetical protein
MAYKFFYPSQGETLNTRGHFKTEMDMIVAEAKHLTFVGWRPDTGADLLQLLIANNQASTVIEIFRPNCEALANMRVANVICDDVRNFDRHLGDHQKEVLIWQDGPEHLLFDDAVSVIEKAKQHFGAIIIATPNGVCEQEAIHGNEHERHLSTWYKEDYERLGFKASLLDQEGFLTGYWKNPRSRSAA